MAISLLAKVLSILIVKLRLFLSDDSRFKLEDREICKEILGVLISIKNILIKSEE